MSVRIIPVVALLATIACGDRTGPTGPATELTVTAEDIASLPVLDVSDGRLLCMADGYDRCPLERAYANRIGNGRIAVWEPGRPIIVWSKSDTAGSTIGSIDSEDFPYSMAAAVRSQGRGYQLVDMTNEGLTLKTISDKGVLQKTESLGGLGPLVGLGFIGSIIVTHQIADWQSDSGAYLAVTRLATPFDTAGTSLVRYRIPWLTGGADGPIPPPLMAAAPVYAVTDDGAVFRNPPGGFEIEHVDSRGNLRWTLRGPDGPPILASELDARVAELSPQAAFFGLSDEDIATMRSRSAATHAPVTGMVVVPSGGVLVALTVVPGAPATEWLRVSAAGVPDARFSLAAGTLPLLVEGDSLLVHRQSETELRELIWLHLGGTD